MRLFSRGCESRQAAYLAGADRLGARERLALEVHAGSCTECADALRNGRPVDTALRGAFASLRERRTIVAPGRVRLAVGSVVARPNPWERAPRVFGRLAEVSVMVGVTLLAVGTSFEPPSAPSSSLPVTQTMAQERSRGQAPLDEIDYLRWVRLVKSNDTPTVSTATRLLMGAFDSDPVEIQKTPSPRF
ncbi:MAG: hypothetical protein E6I18_00125 [Chloroflexi bacterium]|nr:MAG: hypothetical protein E6I18_00125 [Chloroflexota bacterium]